MSSFSFSFMVLLAYLSFISFNPLFSALLLVLMAGFGLFNLLGTLQIMFIYFILLIFLGGVLVLLTWLTSTSNPLISQAFSGSFYFFFIAFFSVPFFIPFPVINSFNIYEFTFFKVLIVLSLIYVLFIAGKLINSTKSLRNL